MYLLSKFQLVSSDGVGIVDFMPSLVFWTVQNGDFLSKDNDDDDNDDQFRDLYIEGNHKNDGKKKKK